MRTANLCIEYKTAISDTLSLQYFQTMAIGVTHQAAQCSVIPEDLSASNPFTFNRITVSLVKSH